MFQWNHTRIRQSTTTHVLINIINWLLIYFVKKEKAPVLLGAFSLIFNFISFCLLLSELRLVPSHLEVFVETYLVF